MVWILCGTQLLDCSPTCFPWKTSMLNFSQFNITLNSENIDLLSSVDNILQVAVFILQPNCSQTSKKVFPSH